MALVRCRDCKQEVGGSAETCPHCGAKSPAQRHPPGWIAKRVVVALLVVFVFAIYRGGSSPSADETEPQAPAVPANTCAFNRSDDRLLGRVTSLQPIGDGQSRASVIMAQGWEALSGTIQEYTVPRSAVLRTCE